MARVVDVMGQFFREINNSTSIGATLEGDPSCIVRMARSHSFVDAEVAHDSISFRVFDAHYMSANNLHLFMSLSRSLRAVDDLVRCFTINN